MDFASFPTAVGLNADSVIVQQQMPGSTFHPLDIAAEPNVLTMDQLSSFSWPTVINGHRYPVQPSLVAGHTTPAVSRFYPNTKPFSEHSAGSQTLSSMLSSAATGSCFPTPTSGLGAGFPSSIYHQMQGAVQRGGGAGVPAGGTFSTLHSMLGSVQYPVGSQPWFGSGQLGGHLSASSSCGQNLPNNTFGSMSFGFPQCATMQSLGPFNTSQAGAVFQATHPVAQMAAGNCDRGKEDAVDELQVVGGNTSSLFDLNTHAAMGNSRLALALGSPDGPTLQSFSMADTSAAAQQMLKSEQESGNNGPSSISVESESAPSASGIHSRLLPPNHPLVATQIAHIPLEDLGQGVDSSATSPATALALQERRGASNSSFNSHYHNGHNHHHHRRYPHRKADHQQHNHSGEDSLSERQEILQRQHIACQVCHQAVSNGLHFGARTCAACAAFFRRSISDQKRYVCKRSQRCVIRPGEVQGYRKLCRNCRMKRCIEVGMLPENVQNKRHKIEPLHYNPAGLDAAAMISGTSPLLLNNNVDVVSEAANICGHQHLVTASSNNKDNNKDIPSLATAPGKHPLTQPLQPPGNMAVTSSLPTAAEQLLQLQLPFAEELSSLRFCAPQLEEQMGHKREEDSIAMRKVFEGLGMPSSTNHDLQLPQQQRPQQAIELQEQHPDIELIV